MQQDIISLQVEDFGSSGEAVGKFGGKTVFARARNDVALGDKIFVRIVEDKKNFILAEFADFAEKKPFRPPFCPEKLCAGCPLAATDMESQIAFKTKKIRLALQKIGGFSLEKVDSALFPPIPCENVKNYRNKVSLAIRAKKAQAGFFEAKSNQFVPIESCQIAPQGSEEILKAFRSYLSENGGAKVSSLIVRRSSLSGGFLICIVSPQKALPNEKILVKTLASAVKLEGAVLFSDANFPQLSGGRALFGEGFFAESLSVAGQTLTFRVSAASFFQVNREQTQRLYEAALSFADLDESQNALDVFCGVGAISLFAAKRAKKVFGVEISAKSIADAVESARLNGIENAEFFAVSAENIPEKILREKIDAVFVDPPRKGLEKRAREKIAKIRPKKIIYISCDIATFSRDAKALCLAGYDLQKLLPVDQFPHTVHTETVALFCRRC